MEDPKVDPQTGEVIKPAAQGGDQVTPSVEELMTQLKKSNEDREADRSKLNELAEANSRLTQMLEAAAKRGEPPPTAGEKRKLARDYAVEFNMSNDAALAIIEEAESRAVQTLTERWQQAEALRSIAEEFYGSNPDLKEHKAIVQAFANDLRSKEPGITIKQALDKTAAKTREYIKSIQDKGNGSHEPPITTPGGSIRAGGPSPAPGADVELTPDQELQADIKARRDRQAKAVGGAR